MKTIDLRSDTVTQADEGMREAMASARVGDSMFGEDPSVLELEARVANTFGFEHAVFVPTGTLSNQLLLRTFTEPGEAIVAQTSNHIVQYESGALSALTGLQQLPAPLSDSVHIDERALGELKTTEQEFYKPPVTLVAIENTHMGEGGRIYERTRLEALSERCRELELNLHIDGARIWHAMNTSQNSANWLGSCVDSLSVCLSKGLGAPVGSCALFHGSSRLHRFKRFQKMFGGCTRQAGHMAAAASYALENNLSRLHETHTLAESFVNAFRKTHPDVSVSSAGTNIVLFTCANALAFAGEMSEQFGIKLSVLSPTVARAVFHIDVLGSDLLDRLSTRCQK